MPPRIEGSPITTVYAALSSGDLETIRQAYAATGSDDWITSNPHLRSSAVRSKLLTTLRSDPAHTANGSYRYSAAGYRVTRCLSRSFRQGCELN